MRKYEVTLDGNFDEWETILAPTLRDAAYRFTGKHLANGDWTDGLHCISVQDPCDVSSYLSIIIDIGDR